MMYEGRNEKMADLLHCRHFLMLKIDLQELDADVGSR